MFNFIYRKKLLTLILVILVAAFAVFRLVTGDMLIAGTSSEGLLYPSIGRFLLTCNVANRIILGILIVLQTIGLQYFMTRNNFLSEDSTIPILFFLTFSLCSVPFPAFSPAIVTNPFILILLLLNIDNYSRSSKNVAFFSGCIVALLTLIDPATLFLVFFLIGALFISRTDNAKQFILMLIGLLLPFIYLVSYCFVTDRIRLVPLYFSGNTLLGFISHSGTSTFALVFLLVSFLLFFVYALSATKLYYDNKVILLRKKTVILNALFFSTILLALFGHLSVKQAIPYFILPLSIYCSMLCQIKNRRLISDILILSIIAGILLPNLLK